MLLYLFTCQCHLNNMLFVTRKGLFPLRLRALSQGLLKDQSKVLVLVLVLEEKSWSWSWSLALKSLSLSWSLDKSP